MTYKAHSVLLATKIFLLFLCLLLLALALAASNYYLALTAGVISVICVYNLYKFLAKRFIEIDDFFESVKYRDFSRRFVEDLGPRDMRQLRRGFNQVNQVVQDINAKKEVQYLYLQKILQMIDIGIIAYDIESGEVLWANDTIRNILDLPSFKNIRFVSKRRPTLYKEVFDTYYSEATSIGIRVKNEKLKVLISDTVFQIQEQTYKLVVLQNIDETLNQNESQAWKKLLSVMTHEIMNSIAPISSLADTLEIQVKLARQDPEQYQLEMEDFHAGLTSIKKRSEGLMKFAKTYRSLNKITNLNLEKVYIRELFKNIQHLLQASLRDKKVEMEFLQDSPNLEVDIDSYLIEQVLINLILNAVEASNHLPYAKVVISAEKEVGEHPVIRVADSGTGIPSEILDNIFVPFFTTKSNGSGIGLSLCKQIVMLHKGRIHINSLEGKGTVVSVIFDKKA